MYTLVYHLSCHLQQKPQHLKYRGYDFSNINSAIIASSFSHPDFTVGSGISPDRLIFLIPVLLLLNSHFFKSVRGLYRRLGIAPCPEESSFLRYYNTDYSPSQQLINSNHIYIWIAVQKEHPSRLNHFLTQ